MGRSEPAGARSKPVGGRNTPSGKEFPQYSIQQSLILAMLRLSGQRGGRGSRD